MSSSSETSYHSPHNSPKNYASSSSSSSSHNSKEKGKETHSGSGGKFLHDLAYGEYSFRPINDHENNSEHPSWGRAVIPFLRKAKYNYSDGVGAPTENLPNPRAISNLLCAQDDSIEKAPASAMFWLWGQFIDHTITLTHTGDEAMSIPIPSGDSVFDPNSEGGKTLNTKRSEVAAGTGTADKAREQVNSLSSYLDGNNTYGTDLTRNHGLRVGRDGLLKVSPGDLPPLNDGTHDNAQEGSPSSAPYLCGDVRANEHIGLLSIHTVFIREHNHWAKLIAKENDKLSDTQIYERARMMVEAEIQAITYNEFLPLLLGENCSDQYKGYKRDVNASLTNEFATAAFRFGHSMVSSAIPRLNEKWEEVPEGSVVLRDTFFQSHMVANDGGIDPILRGFIMTPSEKLDVHIIDDLRNFLFGKSGRGLDLVALNIQRGRDHGLGSYNDHREAYGLPRVTRFDQISNNVEVQNRLAELYESPDKIDLFIGGLLEENVKGTMVGPLFRAILSDQFSRLRDGDSHWYETKFSPSQVEEVSLNTLSRIIERNTDLEDLPFHILLRCD